MLEADAAGGGDVPGSPIARVHRGLQNAIADPDLTQSTPVTRELNEPQNFGWERYRALYTLQWLAMRIRYFQLIRRIREISDANEFQIVVLITIPGCAATLAGFAVYSHSETAAAAAGITGSLCGVIAGIGLVAHLYYYPNTKRLHSIIERDRLDHKSRAERVMANGNERAAIEKGITVSSTAVDATSVERERASRTRTTSGKVGSDRPVSVERNISAEGTSASLSKQVSAPTRHVDVSRVDAIRRTIWNHASPYNTALAGPEPIIAMGEDAVPVVIEIFANPLHSSGQGDANQALLAICLNMFADRGNQTASDFLLKVARGGVAVTPDSYGSTAEAIAGRYVQERLTAPAEKSVSATPPLGAGDPIVLTDDVSFAGRKVPAGTHGRIVNNPSRVGGGPDCVDCQLDGQQPGPYSIGKNSLMSLQDPMSAHFRPNAMELPIRRTAKGDLLTDLGRRVRIKLVSGSIIEGIITSGSYGPDYSGYSDIEINDTFYSNSEIAEATWLR
ncbi:MAG: hypothetical protein O2945_11590 [Planctomycetota bacterium]|nr:hypothetical protein [Planctomycetota bacterium]